MKKYLLALTTIALISCSKEEEVQEIRNLDDFTGVYSGQYSIQQNNGKSNSNTKGDTVVLVNKSESKNCLYINDIYFTSDGRIIDSSNNSSRTSSTISIYYRNDVLNIKATSTEQIVNIQLSKTKH